MADDTVDDTHIYRPVPRRAFEPQILRDADQVDSPSHAFSQDAQSPPAATLQSSRSSDFLAQLNARLLRTYHAREDAPESPVEGAGEGGTRAAGRGLPQTKSFLNMKSALFGIYDDVGASTEVASDAQTPWGTGAETPGADAPLSMRRASGAAAAAAAAAAPPARRARTPASVFAAKLLALFTFGVFYGTIVSHLHDTRQLAAVHVRGVDRSSWFYVTTWGCAGVALGSLLPWVDLLWRQQGEGSNNSSNSRGKGEGEAREDVDPREDVQEIPLSEQVNDVVRSVAAFVGVAFAIRRLPWQSTLQLTLTLALVNPALWYILDRSKPGLSFSLVVTSLLTSLIFLSTPEGFAGAGYGGGNGTVGNGTGNGGVKVSPSGSGSGSERDLFAGVISYDNLAVVTWVGSVLFCSCVCFGNIGRRLAVLEGGWRGRGRGRGRGRK